jgi:hypothetical protein
MSLASLSDEKSLVTLTLIAGLFILIVLNSTIGTVYFAMAATYAIALSLGSNRVFQFTKGKFLTVDNFMYAILGIAGFLFVTSIAVGGYEKLFSAVTFFGSTLLTQFTFDNPIVKLLTFGVFIPVVETLFFYGVIYKLVINKTRGSGKRFDTGTIIAVAMVASVATAFHFYVRMLNDTSLIADLIFFGSSAIIVSKKMEMSAAALMHIIYNTAVMAILLGIVG